MLQRPAVRKGLVVPSGTNPILNPPSAEEQAKLSAGGRALIAQQVKENEEKYGRKKSVVSSISNKNVALGLGGLVAGVVLGVALRR